MRNGTKGKTSTCISVDICNLYRYRIFQVIASNKKHLYIFIFFLLLSISLSPLLVSWPTKQDGKTRVSTIIVYSKVWISARHDLCRKCPIVIPSHRHKKYRTRVLRRARSSLKETDVCSLFQWGRSFKHCVRGLRFLQFMSPPLLKLLQRSAPTNVYSCAG